MYQFHTFITQSPQTSLDSPVYKSMPCRPTCAGADPAFFFFFFCQGGGPKGRAGSGEALVGAQGAKPPEASGFPPFTMRNLYPKLMYNKGKEAYICGIFNTKNYTL